jgi:uncharacterized protein YoaH (UPF0181 family)
MTNAGENRLERIESTQAIHSEILNQLAIANRELTQFSTRMAERHSDRLDRLEESALRHDQALTRLEESAQRQGDRLDLLEDQTRRNAESVGRLELQVEQMREIVTTSISETIQLVASNSRQIAQNNERIERILEYLFQQRPNGRSGNGS